MSTIKITECPRDAMQGLHEFIPTAEKIRYINALLKAGFDCIDFGSFVNPKVIPQLRDTAEVLDKLDKEGTDTALLAIIGNRRGAEEACSYEKVNFIGFPFSVSETFLQRNINSNFKDAFERILDFLEITDKTGKQLLVYLSMGFGNPYGDPWNDDIVGEWTEKLATAGVKYIALSDTIGEATPEVIDHLFRHLIPAFPNVEIGAHLHTTPSNWEPNVKAAFEAGCKKFDTAMKGFGGCPMAKDELTGNLPTENLLLFLEQEKYPTRLKRPEFFEALQIATEIFPPVK